MREKADHNDLTLLLQKAGADEQLLGEHVLPLVYDELRRLAAAQMARQASGQTLQPTALVHEAWLRLVPKGERTWKSRKHFYRTAALAMRHILIHRARQKASLKRGGGWERKDIADLQLAAELPGDHLLLLDESLQRLEREDPESAEVVMLKVFSGLTNKETARTLDISEATVERRWAFAKVCLFQMICESQNGASSKK